MSASKVVNVLALLVCILGGAFFGLFGCGGYAWHRIAFLAVMAAVVLTALRSPVSVAHPGLWRAGLIVAASLGYFMSEAIAGTFYPGPPASWAEFGLRLRMNLVHGPC